jgi:hypothetical protein
VNHDSPAIRIESGDDTSNVHQLLLAVVAARSYVKPQNVRV